MEYGPSHEVFLPAETERSEDLSVDSLPVALGYVETDELQRLRSSLHDADALHDPSASQDLLRQYHILGEEVVNQEQGASYGRAQIGLIVTMAILRRDMGRMDAYVESLEDAQVYASNMGYEDVVSVLKAAVDWNSSQGNRG